MENLNFELEKPPVESNGINRSDPNIKANNGLKSIEMGFVGANSGKDKLNISAENVKQIIGGLKGRRSPIVRKSYSTLNLLDLKKGKEQEEKLQKQKVINKANLIKERQNKHKSFVNFLTILHSTLFIAIIFMQFEVTLRFNIRSSLQNYFTFNADFDYMGENQSFPESIFKQLVNKIYKNSFWFNEKKFEIVTNVRVTQRVSKFDNYTTLSLRLLPETYKRLQENRIKNNYDIDPYSDFNEKIEFKDDLPNGYKYQIDDTFLRKGGYTMSFNVASLMNVTANTDVKTYYSEGSNTSSPKNNTLKTNLINQFKKFFTPTFTVLLIDFVVANHELGYYSSVIFKVLFTNQGYYNFLYIETQNVNLYQSATDVVRTVIEVLFTIVTLFSFAHICYFDFIYAKKLATIREHDEFMIEMNKILPKSSEENSGLDTHKNLKDSDIIGANSITDNKNNKALKQTSKFPQLQNKKEGNEEKAIISIKKAHTFDNTLEERKKHKESLVEHWTWPEFFKSYCDIYFLNALDLIRNLALILSFVLIIRWFMYVTYVINNKNNITQGFNTYNPIIRFDFSDSLIEISQQFKQYIKIMAITALFVFLRLVKVCETFFPTLNAYIEGFRKSLSDILSFFMLFFLIIFGISLILYFYFSVDIEQFNSLILSFLNNLFFFIGSTDYQLVYLMFGKNNSFTIVYFLAVGMFIKFAFNRILLAIILYNFEGLKYSKGNRYKCVPVSEFKSKAKPDLIYGLYCAVKKSPKRVINFICCRDAKNKKKVQEASKAENQKPQTVIQSEELFDLKNGISNRNAADTDKNLPEKSQREGNLKQSKILSSKIIDNNEIVLAINAEKEEEKIQNDVNGLNNNNNDNNEKSLRSKKSFRPSLKPFNNNNNNQLPMTERVLTLDDLRFIYSKYIENFEMISRNPYFDSPEDIERVNVYYEKKFEANFKRNIMYLILQMFLILSILFNVNSPWRFGFSRLMDNSLYEKGYQNLTYLNTTANLNEFFLKNMPLLFSKSKAAEGNEYFILDSSYLIGNKFFFTKKRQINRSDSVPGDQIRVYEPIDIFKTYKFEDKQDQYFQYNSLIKKLAYDKDGIYSYANNGGLTGLFDINDFYKVMESAKKFNETLSDGFDNFVVLEFMIHNLELKVYAKYTIMSLLDYGYIFYNYYNVDIISEDFSSNEFQLLRFIFVLVLFVLVIYETMVFIRELKELNDSYNSWFVKRNIAVSDQAKSVRKFLNSEFIRKLKVILNPIRASMFIILILIYIYILMFIISVFLESNFYSLLKEYSNNLKKLKSDSKNTNFIDLDTQLLYKLKNQFTKISFFRDSYDKLSAFLLFIGSLRVMFSLNIGKYFNAISQIAVKTLTKNLMIVILLFLILPSFIFYSYLVFGVFDTGYRSFIDSILSNFLKLFDFRNDISNSIDQDIKFIYVLSFGFIMNLIILNLFVSIINNSYQKVKSKIFYSSENFSWIKVIFFCCNRKKIISNTVGKEIIQNEIENFVKTHEAEPMVNLTAEFRNYHEFANYEIEKLKQVNDSLSWIQNRTDLMQFSLICKDNNQVSSSLTDNRFKNVDQDLMNLQYFAGLTYQMELVNSLEKDILDIKESSHKLSVFVLSQKKKNVVNDEDFENEKMIKELIALEKEYMDLISDIEDLRKIKNEIDETCALKKKDVIPDDEDDENDD